MTPLNLQACRGRLLEWEASGHPVSRDILAGSAAYEKRAFSVTKQHESTVGR